jgi:hypothetical protein
MPYKAAKAIAATFCYNIRHALTPLFGKEFLNMCVHPKDPKYAKFLIDPAIVRECTDETNRWRTEGVTYQPHSVEQHAVTSMPSMPSTPSTPQMRFDLSPWGYNTTNPRHKKAIDQESGYGTEEDPGRDYMFSPEISPRSTTWTSINRSQSPSSPSAFSAPHRWLTSVPGGFNDEKLRTKRTLSKVTYGGNEAELCPPTTVSDSDTGSDFGDGYHTEKEIDAAEILLGLSNAECALHRIKRTRHGARY